MYTQVRVDCVCVCVSLCLCVCVCVGVYMGLSSCGSFTALACFLSFEPLVRQLLTEFH